MDSSLLTAFGFIAAGIAVVVYGIAQWDRLSAARNWTTVVGEVYAARVVEGRNDADYGKEYRADIRYGYVVDGVELAGSQLQLTTLAGTSHAYAERLVKSYPPGRRVTVHYDPKNPHDAVLEMPTNAMVPMLIIVVGVVVSAIGGYLWWSWYTA